MATRYIVAAADATEAANLISNLSAEVAGIVFKRDDNTLGIYDPDAAAFTYFPLGVTVTAALLNAFVGGVAAAYRIARGVAAVTGTGTVVTGLATVVAVIATPQSDLDGDTLAGVSATIGNQAGAPAAGSIILKAWKVTTGGAAGNPTMIAADAAKNINWIAIGT